MRKEIMAKIAEELATYQRILKPTRHRVAS